MENKKYKLRKDVTWDEVKEEVEEWQFPCFEGLFEEIEELPKIELKPITCAYFKIHEPLGTCYRIDSLKSMHATVFITKEEAKEFNEKCSQLFGFEFIEPTGE